MAIIELILLIGVLLISLFALFLSLSFFFGAPFITTSKKILKEMITLSAINKSDTVVDLGSGDGRVLIEAARKCSKAIGYEINPFLVGWSRIATYIQGTNNVVIKWQNYNNANLENSTIVYMYSIRGFVPSLERKLKKELKPGTKIISYKFEVSAFKLLKKTNSGIFLYEA